MNKMKSKCCNADLKAVYYDYVYTKNILRSMPVKYYYCSKCGLMYHPDIVERGGN